MAFAAPREMRGLGALNGLTSTASVAVGFNFFNGDAHISIKTK
jgi:hypothetical protein